MNSTSFTLLQRIDLMADKRLALLVFVTAIAASLLFSTFLYPLIAHPLNSKIAEDGYDKLAYGLYHLGTLTYFPSDMPTVMRGPAYPAFVAAVFAVGEQFYPRSVQIAQALLHGATSVLCLAVGLLLWNHRRACTAAALLCAVHPFLLWYSARIVTETVAVFLFTLFVALLLWYARCPTSVRVSLLGIVGGVGALCKQTFLPLPFLTFAFFVFGLKNNNRRLQHAFVLIGTTLLVVAPWTLRNYHVAHRIIPVHTLIGYNVRAGDALAEHYFEAPFSYMELISIGAPSILASGDTVRQVELHNAERRGDFDLDARILQTSLERYAADPMFLLRKMLLNSVMFWTISGSVAATVVTSLLQIPLLVLTVLGGRRAIRAFGLRSLAVLPLGVMGLYFLSHVPVYALARFGLVLVPTMLAYAVGVWHERN